VSGQFCGPCQLPLAMCEHGLELPRTAPEQQAWPGPGVAAGRWFRPDWQAIRDLVAEHALAASGLGPWIPAQYYGTCAACGHRWEPGDQIRASDEDAGWLCQRCGSD
jgi:hypothetical protein